MNEGTEATRNIKKKAMRYIIGFSCFALSNIILVFFYHKPINILNVMAALFCLLIVRQWVKIYKRS